MHDIQALVWSFEKLNIEEMNRVRLLIETRKKTIKNEAEDRDLYSYT